MGKRFDLSDVLSITTGRLVSTRHIDGVYDILGYMTGEAPFTHQLPRFSDECRPHLLRQHPQLVDVTGDEVTTDNWRQWLAAQRVRFGDSLEIDPIPGDDHAARHPIKELVDMVGEDRVIVVQPEP
jgi:hypothetical protein